MGLILPYDILLFVFSQISMYPNESWSQRCPSGFKHVSVFKIHVYDLCCVCFSQSDAISWFVHDFFVLTFSFKLLRSRLKTNILAFSTSAVSPGSWVEWVSNQSNPIPFREQIYTSSFLVLLEIRHWMDGQIWPNLKSL